MVNCYELFCNILKNIYNTSPQFDWRVTCKAAKINNNKEFCKNIYLHNVNIIEKFELIDFPLKNRIIIKISWTPIKNDVTIIKQKELLGELWMFYDAIWYV